MSLRHPSTSRVARPRALAGALLIVLLAGTLAGAVGARAADTSAGATCPATIAGQELGRGTVEVGKNDTIRVQGEGGSTNVVSLQFGGTTFASQTVPPGGTTIDVADYAVWGVGLYQVLWQGANGCTVSGAVHVDGSFLGSRIGWASAGTIGLALPFLLMLGWKTTINPRGRWKLKVVARASGGSRSGSPWPDAPTDASSEMAILPAIR